ncbi:MAG: hexapeptide transferase [Phycisphaerae bacterium]|nr:hexapeptide transferase [Phycisphaerae bacterium]
MILSLLKKITEFSILGYTDPVDRGCLLGATWLGDDPQIARMAEGKTLVGVLGIGSIRAADVQRRKSLFDYLRSLKIGMPPLVSPAAIVNEGVDRGDGLVAMDGVVVHTGTILGEAVILNTRCSVDHDCHIGGFTHIAPGAVVCGDVRIGFGCLIGAGSVICPGCQIGDECIIGAGAVVTRDCTEAGTYVGVPARKVA